MTMRCHSGRREESPQDQGISRSARKDRRQTCSASALFVEKLARCPALEPPHKTVDRRRHSFSPLRLSALLRQGSAGFFTHWTAHITLHLPCLTLHPPQLTLHAAHVTLHPPHMKLHSPHVTLHSSHITLHMPQLMFHLPHMKLHPPCFKRETARLQRAAGHFPPSIPPHWRGAERDAAGAS